MESLIKGLSGPKFYIFFLLSFFWSVSSAQSFPAPVEVDVVSKRLMAPIIWVAGSVVSRDDAEIAAEVEGRLTQVSEEGAKVNAGDVLASIDNTFLKIALIEAEAEVSREEANLGFLNQEVQRLQRLARQNNAARTQLDETQAERDATINDLAAAKARVSFAQERIQRSVLKAPFDGVVVSRLKRTGEWVGSGEAVIQLVDDNRLEIETSAPLKLRPFLKAGQQVQVKADEVEVNAEIRVLVAAGEGLSRLMRLRLDIEFFDWYAGQPVRVALPSAKPRDVLVVPRDALVLRGSGTSVFRVKEDNTAEKISVTTGIAVGDYIEVSGVLKEGDRVITRGGERLRPGQQLRLLSPAAKVSSSKEQHSSAGNVWWQPGQESQPKESDSQVADDSDGSNPWWSGESSDSTEGGESSSNQWFANAEEDGE